MRNMTKLIAEIGWNHMGDMDLAKDMILAAKSSGADFVKTQIFNIKRLKPGPWDTDGRLEIYKGAELSKDQHFILRDYCDKVDIKFLTSVSTFLKVAGDTPGSNFLGWKFPNRASTS